MKSVFLMITSFVLISCSSDKGFKEKLTKTLNDNPEIVLKLIEDNPTKFLTTLQKASQKAQRELSQKRQQEEQRKRLDYLKNPLKPVISKNDIIRGDINAPITIVEYSDFECPFCSRSYLTVKELLKKYPKKVKFVYKHLPLNFHPQAMISAKYYEAIRLQSKEKAIKFHDIIFENQKKLKNGEPFLKSIAKELKVNMIKLNKDLDSRLILNKINADVDEAKKFSISGTPAFIINGIPLKGAYPIDEFEKVISLLNSKAPHI